jgi:hypothetical protein
MCGVSRLPNSRQFCQPLCENAIRPTFLTQSVIITLEAAADLACAISVSFAWHARERISAMLGGVCSSLRSRRSAWRRRLIPKPKQPVVVEVERNGSANSHRQFAAQRSAGSGTPTNCNQQIVDMWSRARNVPKHPRIGNRDHHWTLRSTRRRAMACMLSGDVCHLGEPPLIVMSTSKALGMTWVHCTMHRLRRCVWITDWHQEADNRCPANGSKSRRIN